MAWDFARTAKTKPRTLIIRNPRAEIRKARISGVAGMDLPRRIVRQRSYDRHPTDGLPEGATLFLPASSAPPAVALPSPHHLQHLFQPQTQPRGVLLRSLPHLPAQLLDVRPPPVRHLGGV